MSIRTRIGRIVIGLIAAVVVTVGCFMMVERLIPTWGATPEEVARVVPGDELTTNPLVNWTHGITIDAQPEEVWGWIAQIGERRGGFYSYTFIENQMGNGDVYHNAERVVPEWQNPQPGDALIGGAFPLNVLEIETAKYMLAYMEGPFQWAWGWHLEPLNTRQTRLMVRMRIQADTMGNLITGRVMNFGGFVMEQRMLQGIKARAEGIVEPVYTETLEIVLWVAALAAGILAALFFVAFKDWVVPFSVGIGAVIVLFVFTFWQPPLWTRIVADIVLWAALIWYALQQYNARQPRIVSPDRPRALSYKPGA